jgi:hypothetical protein
VTLAGREATVAGLDALAEFFRHGLTSESRSWWSEVPGLAHLLAEIHPAAAGEVHTRITLLEAPPLASLFLDPSGLRRREIAPDHVGDVLSATAGQLARGHDAAAAGLADGLLAWFPAWIAGIVEVDGAAFYQEAGDLALTLACRLVDGRDGDAALAAPGLDVDLGAPGTGIDDIASALVVPARSGGFLAPASLRVVARELDLPRALGSARASATADLFRAAAHFDRVSALCATLDARFDRFDHAWALAGARDGNRYAPTWRARIAGTRAMLAEIAREATLRASDAP